MFGIADSINKKNWLQMEKKIKKKKKTARLTRGETMFIPWRGRVHENLVASNDAVPNQGRKQL